MHFGRWATSVIKPGIQTCRGFLAWPERSLSSETVASEIEEISVISPWDTLMLCAPPRHRHYFGRNWSFSSPLRLIRNVHLMSVKLPISRAREVDCVNWNRSHICGLADTSVVHCLGLKFFFIKIRLGHKFTVWLKFYIFKTVNKGKVLTFCAKEWDRWKSAISLKVERSVKN